MKVLVTGNFPNDIVAPVEAVHETEKNSSDLPMPRDELLDKIRDKDGLLCMITDRIDAELLDLARDLKMIANCAVGYDNVDLEEATGRNIWISNTPGVLTDATADLTFALILTVARRVIEGENRVRSGRWKHFAPFVFLGREVTGKTLGIVGLGQIGKAVARRARGFSMPILYHNRSRILEAEEKRLGARYAKMDELLRESDFVSIHVPLTDETRHLIGRTELAMMKPTAFLINASRGPVVDEQALLEALQNNLMAGAGLDVYEKEPTLTAGLTDLENVVLLPHIGSATIETRRAMASLAVKNLLAGLRGEVPPNCLNPGAR